MKTITNRVYTFIWMITLALLIVGFMPYKSIKKQRTDENELLLTHHESYCTALFTIEEGKLHIPKEKFDSLIKNDCEINIDSNHTLSNLSYDLIVSSDFIVSYELIGVDDKDPSNCHHRYEISIKDWWPTKYSENFWAFNKFWFFTYLIFTSILTLLSSILILLNLTESLPGNIKN